MIPADVRRRLGLSIGSEIVGYVDGGRYVIESRDAALNGLRAGCIAAIPPGESAVEELVATRRAEAAADAADHHLDAETPSPSSAGDMSTP